MPLTEKKILCAVDFSSGSRTAAARACVLARDGGGGLALVHVYQVPTLAFAGGAPTVAPLLAAMSETAMTELHRCRDELEATFGVRAELAALEGVPWRQILLTATSLDAGLIVLGAHGQSNWKEALLGTVAERVVRHASCSVLVVREDAAPAAS